jgi:uncharacterized membrane protein
MRPPDIGTWSDTWADVRRSFADFLGIPSITVLAFLLLAGGTYLLDRHTVDWIEPTRRFLKHHLITDPDTTNTLLGTIAGSVITVTSITFSLLLLAVQQSAAALTNQVLDQFLRRRLNQLYFGVFVGVSLFALLILATNDTQVTPVFGAAVALLLTLIALMILVMLLYTTLNQMRPDRIIGSIHDLTLSARMAQRELLMRTRSEPTLHAAPAMLTVRARTNGYLAGLDLDRIGEAAKAVRGEVEVVLLVALGDYLCCGEPVAEIAAPAANAAHDVGKSVQAALSIERQRDFHRDPGFGVSQLATVGWTAISTAKSNPSPGLAAIRNLRDLLIRWLDESPAPGGHSGDREAAVPVVYRDNVREDVLGAFESLLIVASESMQHQAAAELYHTIAVVFDRLPDALQSRAEDALLRSLAALGDHVPASDLDAALSEVAAAVSRAGRPRTAAAIEQARLALAQSVGVLGSRGTRAEAVRRSIP